MIPFVVRQTLPNATVSGADPCSQIQTGERVAEGSPEMDGDQEFLTDPDPAPPIHRRSTADPPPIHRRS
ncbi:MAG: hypothetical protein WD342_12895, partial [Verrucomicrobiales bacterium]